MKKIKTGVLFLLFFCCMSSCYKKSGMENEKEKKIKKNSEFENKEKEKLITIASFNAMRLGEKEKNYEVMAKIVSKFDLTGIEEVMNENGLKKLKSHLIKLTGEKWEYIISETGVGSENYKEYYGYVYKSGKIQEVRKVGFYKEKNKNEFMREPYGVYFKSGNFDFVYVICHSIFGDNEKQRLIEAGNYSDVYEYFLNITGESDIIIAGDFNVPADSIAFKDLFLKNNVSYILNPENNLTTISDKKLVNSYDNFFINKEKTREYTGRYGVYNFLKNNNNEVKKYVSDHLLIFSEFSTENDLD
ncbi:MAG: endonuclease/exonuclease/phosphatase family protein [Leptotrichiaceae bacterium]|nr:endonuclease/exonuclease/phosphatase family protein [Leptotrichiaceae bacterium]